VAKEKPRWRLQGRDPAEEGGKSLKGGDTQSEDGATPEGGKKKIWEDSRFFPR